MPEKANNELPSSMHEFYPIPKDKIVKDKGLQSFEVQMKDRKILVKRIYVIQDPEDEDLMIKIKWRDVIDYGRREDLKFHFTQEDITKITESIWTEDFIKQYEAKVAAEKAKLEAQKAAAEVENNPPEEETENVEQE